MTFIVVSLSQHSCLLSIVLDMSRFNCAWMLGNCNQLDFQESGCVGVQHFCCEISGDSVGVQAISLGTASGANNRNSRKQFVGLGAVGAPCSCSNYIGQ